MVENDKPKEEMSSFLLPRFNTEHALATEQLRFSDRARPKQSYEKLIRWDNEI